MTAENAMESGMRPGNDASNTKLPIEQDLAALVGDGGVLVAEAMSLHTTFAIGGPADYFVRPTTVSQVKAVIDYCNAHQLAWRVMGLGSDLLVSDEGLRGVTIQLAENLSSIDVSDDATLVAGETLQEDERYIIAAAGASNAQVADVAQRAGLTGFEFASGIPGSIGGAAIMNAGAYDGEFKQVAVQLMCITPEGEMVTISAEEASWGYRRSMMNEAGMIVVQAIVRLKQGDPLAIAKRMEDLAQRRAEKQPLELPSAGSTFKRPVGHFAGKLIQDAGLQGVRVGGAEVSTKHAGFVVNAGGATAADVKALIEVVQERVFAESGVMLEPEVRMWGF